MEGEFLAKSDMPRLVWRNWAPPKCKFFAGLVLQNRIYAADRLVKRGWPNQGTCPYVMPQLKMLFTWLFIANTLFRFGISSLHGFPTLTIAQPMAALLQGKGLVDGDGQSTRLPVKGLSLSFVVSHVGNLEGA